MDSMRTTLGVLLIAAGAVALLIPVIPGILLILFGSRIVRRQIAQRRIARINGALPPVVD